MHHPPTITKNTKIYDVISAHPETMEVFIDYGIHCVGCTMAHIETLEDGAKSHGINPDNLLEDLIWIIENN